MKTNLLHILLNDLEPRWLDQLDIRNASRWGSDRYDRAVNKADEIEAQASLLTFGDDRHTMTQCIAKAEDLAGTGSAAQDEANRKWNDACRRENKPTA